MLITSVRETTLRTVEQVHDSRELDKYEVARTLWLDWYKAAEQAERANPHSPASERSRGVRPDYRYKAVRVTMRRLRLTAHIRTAALDKLEMLPVVAEKARADALLSFERWVDQNPCTCAGCGAD